MRWIINRRQISPPLSLSIWFLPLCLCQWLLIPGSGSKFVCEYAQIKDDLWETHTQHLCLTVLRMCFCETGNSVNNTTYLHKFSATDSFKHLQEAQLCTDGWTLTETLSKNICQFGLKILVRKHDLFKHVYLEWTYFIILLFYTYQIIVLQLDSQNYNVFVLLNMLAHCVLPITNPVLVCANIACACGHACMLLACVNSASHMQRLFNKRM